MCIRPRRDSWVARDLGMGRARRPGPVGGAGGVPCARHRSRGRDHPGVRPRALTGRGASDPGRCVMPMRPFVLEVFPPRSRGFACDRIALALVAAAVAIGCARTAAAGPTVGFREEFSGTGTSSWSGGTPYSNPGTGGVLGLGDGFLLLSDPIVRHFGSRGLGPEYVGDWMAAGITQVRVWLDDVGDPQPFEIHCG